jgi:hypothetical protein
LGKRKGKLQGTAAFFSQQKQGMAEPIAAHKIDQIGLYCTLSGDFTE